MRLVIITGLSGAGKTQAVRCLEDMGFFCVDNLPPALIPRFAELVGEGPMEKVALVMDVRGGKFFQGMAKALDYLEQQGLAYEILFLEASDETLVRRFKETRRRHPLSAQGRILEGIVEERRRLEELRGKANKIIDTTELSPRQLREQVRELFGEDDDGSLAITVMSFGFKYGIPLDADLVMDVRFLPNPYYDHRLRALTGHEKEVEEYVMNSDVSRTFMTKFGDLLDFLIPYYINEGKSHLGIAIGCTGGRHRSVTLAKKIGEILKSKQLKVTVKHRDVDRQQAVDAGP